MRELGKTNVSMGVMLENSSVRLREEGMPHQNAPSKEPFARLNILKNAGELKIPMTTGILVGIGETLEECIQSILDIKKIHQKYEIYRKSFYRIFIQNQKLQCLNIVHQKKVISKQVVALCRIIMPDANIQIPPNLSPDNYNEFYQSELMIGVEYRQLHQIMLIQNSHGQIFKM